MKKVITLIAVVIILSAHSVCAEIADMSWSESNIEGLRSVDKPALARFINEHGGGAKPETTAEDVGEYTWADLAGDGNYELLVTLDVSRQFYNSLVIYRREASGKITFQEIRGWEIHSLPNVIRDLNGDGRDELIIPEQFPPGVYGAGSVSTAWPAIYELHDGRYVESSRKFVRFYETDVLPKLDQKIADSQAKTASGSDSDGVLVAQVLERDKILRASGVDSTAGLGQARAWIAGDELKMKSVGIAVLQDVGGHEDEVNAAKSMLKRAIAAQHAAGGKS